MINKTNLRRLANSSPMIKDLLKDFTKKVLDAKDAREYVSDSRKPRFDSLIRMHDIAELKTKTYEDEVQEIYNAL